MAEPSRRITRSSSDPAAPSGPAIVATAAEYLGDHRAPPHPAGASAAFTVAPRAAPAQGHTSRPIRTLAGARSPAGSHVASRKPTLSSTTSPGCDSLKTSPRARPDRASHARQGPRAPGQPVLANPVPPENSASVIEMAIELPDRYGADALSAGMGPNTRDFRCLKHSGRHPARLTHHADPAARGRLPRRSIETSSRRPRRWRPGGPSHAIGCAGHWHGGHSRGFRRCGEDGPDQGAPVHSRIGSEQAVDHPVLPGTIAPARGTGDPSWVNPAFSSALCSAMLSTSVPLRCGALWYARTGSERAGAAPARRNRGPGPPAAA